MIRRVAILSVVLLTMGSPLFAQVVTATFTGTVTDATRAVILGADVTLTNQATGVSRAAVTNELGIFVFDFISVGTYSLRVEIPGFKTYVATDIRLESDQGVKRTIVLEVGEVTETITVSGAAPLVSTTHSDQKRHFTTEELAELPAPQRDLNRIIELNAGTAVLQKGTYRGSFVLNGTGQSGSSVTMDGTESTNSTESPQTAILFGVSTIQLASLDAIEEVQISKGVVKAEYARTMGGNINVIMKSGTNQYHGSAFALLGNDNFNAKDPFLAEKPESRFNAYGVSGGGPIIKDRVFFFAAFEGTEQDTQGTVSGDVPTQRLRNLLTVIDPTFKPVLENGFFLPNQPLDSPDALTGFFIGSAAQQFDDQNIFVKGDGWITDSMKLSGLYNRGKPEVLDPRGPGPQQFRLFDDLINRFNINFTVAHPDWNMETRYGYSRPDSVGREQLWNIFEPGSDEASEIRPGDSRITGISGPNFGVGGEFFNHGPAPQEVLGHKVSLHRGNHVIKFGGSVNWREWGRNNWENPVLQFRTFEELLNNDPSGGRFTFGVPDYDGRARDWGLFIQDDWHFSPKWTFNLGLSYDWFQNWRVDGPEGGPPHMFNYGAILDGNFTLGPLLPPNSAYKTDKMNWGPRIGFAYNPDGEAKTVIRSGFGVMFMGINPGILSQIVIEGPDIPFRSNFSKEDNRKFGIKVGGLDTNRETLPLVRGGEAPRGIRAIEKDANTPYVMTWQLSVQRQLNSDTMVEAAYVANHGVKVTLQRPFNWADRITGIRPNPKFTRSLWVDDVDSTSYNSLQVSLRRRFAKGIAGNFHYTWSKTLAFGRGDIGEGSIGAQDFFNLAAERGPASIDLEHVLRANFLWRLPALNTDSPFVEQTINGWNVTGIFRYQSGDPLGVSQPSDAPQRPDVIDFDNAVIKQKTPELPGVSHQWLNPDAFQRVPISPASGSGIRPGNLGRAPFRGPNFWTIDFTIFKDFPITETQKITFRTDFINAFNHPNAANPVTNVASGSFGRIRGIAGEPRMIQFILRYSF